MRYHYLALFAVCLMACDGPDHIPAASDAGVTADTGPSADSGAPPPADAGVTPPADAGGVDAGTAPPEDGGTVVADTGTPVVDAGPPPICGTRGGVTCSQGSFCNFPINHNCGRTDMGGTCMEIPVQCTRELRWVCGCDGVSYTNECVANAAATSVDHEGQCDETPQQGDGACGPPNAPVFCTHRHFCDRPEGQCPVRNESVGGSCTLRPMGCDRSHRPVCGCDGQDYANPCLANAAGTSVRNEGPCR